MGPRAGAAPRSAASGPVCVAAQRPGGSEPCLAPARIPRRDPGAQRLLAVDVVRGTLADGRVRDLPSLARPGDVWVLNDAATLPASLAGRAAGREVEVRLAGRLRSGAWRAVLFGEGSWRDDTDRRPAPPQLAPGDRIDIGGALRAHVTAVHRDSPRLVELRFDPGDDGFWRALYEVGRPVLYSYLRDELPIGALQTRHAERPWAVELPSAGRPLSPGLLSEIRRAGAEVVALTHAAGLSATGDAALDARLPFPERYDIPRRTADAVRHAADGGRRVLAVGTTVARALEGCAREHGTVRAGEGETDLRLGPDTRPVVVDALLTGAHDPSSSHHALLRAFAPAFLLERAVASSVARGYLGHELGDSWLLT